MAIILLTRSGGGETGATLTVLAPAGCSVAVSKGEDSFSGTADSTGQAVFQGLGTGTWRVDISKDGQSASQDVLITADYSVTMTFFQAIITVSYPAGSTCTCTKGAAVLAAPDSSGSVVFTVPETGEWVISCTDGADTTSMTVTITENGQSAGVSLAYQISPSDFDLSSYGTNGSDYQVVDDNDIEIPASQWGNVQNWKLRLLTSGTLVPLRNGEIDVFLVAAGGSAASTGSGSTYYGRGGEAKMLSSIAVTVGTQYTIEIGAGSDAAAGSNTAVGKGGNTSAFGQTTVGGDGSSNVHRTPDSKVFEWLGDSGRQYGGSSSVGQGEDNTGEGAYNNKENRNFAGGSGIVIIRNAREVA